MAEGIYTEREWRLRGACVRSTIPVCWGAQYVQPVKRRNWQQNRTVHGVMLLCAVLVSLLIPVCCHKRAEPAAYPMAVAPASAEQMNVRKVAGVSFAMPIGLNMVQRTYSAEELYRGKLLLIDDEHPLPAQAPHPNTLTIATYGKGMVPVNDLSLKTGRETIRALTGLFADLRGSGTGGFVVWQGAQTPAEQQELLLARLRREAGAAPLNEAARQVLQAMDTPGSGELQQEYTVELRMGREGSQLPDERPLEETVQGRQLLRFAWRNGFIRSKPDGTKQHDFRFRYVGIAHATAMTYLDVDLPTYLAILHEKRIMTVQGENGQLYLIQCIPAQGNHAVFQVPQGANNEVSFDNTGYAIVVSILDRNWNMTDDPVAKASNASEHKNPRSAP